MAAVSDLHKSAFWIYGVTAMVMREPLSTLIRHAAASGISSPSVQEEALRVAVVLALMSRFFLAAGLYFDEVYLRPDSVSAYPRRSYPLDFVFGLMQLLVAVGASAAVADTKAYAAAIAVFLLFENVWFAVSAALRLSTARRVVQMARPATLSLAACAAVYVLPALAGLARLAGAFPLLLLLALTGWDAARTARAYNACSLPAPPPR